MFYIALSVSFRIPKKYVFLLVRILLKNLCYEQELSSLTGLFVLSFLHKFLSPINLFFIRVFVKVNIKLIKKSIVIVVFFRIINYMNVKIHKKCKKKTIY